MLVLPDGSAMGPQKLGAIYTIKKQIKLYIFINGLNGAPGTIRTSDPQIRSLMLYPAELRARNGVGEPTS